jgi:hypothetical protein
MDHRGANPGRPRSRELGGFRGFECQPWDKLQRLAMITPSAHGCSASDAGSSTGAGTVDSERRGPSAVCESSTMAMDWPVASRHTRLAALGQQRPSLAGEPSGRGSGTLAQGSCHDTRGSPWGRGWVSPRSVCPGGCPGEQPCFRFARRTNPGVGLRSGLLRGPPRRPLPSGPPRPRQ